MAALPRYIPIKDAAQTLDLPLAALHEMVDSGKIDAIALPDGDIAVSETGMSKPLRKEDLPEYKMFANLANNCIGINEAAHKYDIPFSTLRGWVNKKYILKSGRDGQKVLINEQDVAYCAEIYHHRKGQGKWLFNPDGTPYQPKSE